MADLPGSESEAGQLPIPYRNPWLSLRHDLLAVSADLWLRLRLLWRRNRDGDLSLPPFWPRAIAPMFWPLLLSMLLILFGSLAWPLIASFTASAPPASSSPARAFTSSSQGSPTSSPTSSSTSSSTSSLKSSLKSSSSDQSVPIELTPDSPVDHGAGLPIEINTEDSPEISLDISTEIPGSLPVTPLPLQVDLLPQEPQPLAEFLRRDPLFSLFAEADLPEGLLVAVEPVTQLNGLQLRLASSWWELPPSRRRELASRWLKQAEEMGYDELRLLDRGDHLLARNARVGEGMILFEQEMG